MSKATVIAIFMVVLVQGMVTKETQGDTCHHYLRESEPWICDSVGCAAVCTSKHHGKGMCIDRATCVCTFSCSV
ncbi:hypothetical protein CARUB_v10011517mg [Capsella rubella]|uniref:Knottin scorpion toxin-like domain-containing protein n=1 Tax=Capsella rubella TaxID=81985 RepID=R0IPB1_9BRAS|nr:hypothetical protein CARUB_v10011517mg [Capsella rubella]